MSIPKELEQLLLDAAAKDASDVFLMPGEPPALRLRGLIERTSATPLTASEIRAYAEAIVGPEELAKIGRETGSVSKSLTLSDNRVVRVGVARSCGEITLVVRFMISRIISVEAMRVPEAMLQMTSRGNGLLLVAGHNGSGKMNAAIGLVDYINRTRACHICTVEDPIGPHFEPKKALIQQREPGVDIPDARAGLKAAMSQDLDVLFINELKTLEEIEGCIALAETGHLVIAVIHAPTPQGAIERIIEIFPENMRESIGKTLSRIIIGASCQRLLPKIGGGRVAAYGVLVVDDEMRRAIADQRNMMDRKTFPEGCQTMAEHIRQLLSEGLISEETATRALGEI